MRPVGGRRLGEANRTGRSVLPGARSHAAAKFAFKPLRRNTKFASDFNANQPVQSSREKFSCFVFSEIMFL